MSTYLYDLLNLVRRLQRDIANLHISDESKNVRISAECIENSLVSKIQQIETAEKEQEILDLYNRGNKNA